METDEDALIGLLREAETPKRPRVAFDRQLREELFGEQVAGDAAHSSTLEAEREVEPPDGPSPLHLPPHRRPRRPLLAVAAAAVLVVVGAMLWWNGGESNTQVVTDLVPTSTTVDVTTTIPDVVPIDLDAAQQACVEFAAASFGERNRLQVVGPNNGAHLTTSEEVTEAATALGAAFQQLRADLGSAGVDGDDFRRDAARLEVLIASASTIAQSGRRTGAIEELNRAEELLIAIDATLTSHGVPQCF